MRGPLNPMQKDFAPPTWRIWEYDIAADNLHSLTDDVTADGGQDVSPHYLRATASTRTAHTHQLPPASATPSRCSCRMSGKAGFEAQIEDGGESAFTLNVLDPTLTGPSAFQQISFNQDHDLNRA